MLWLQKIRNISKLNGLTLSLKLKQATIISDSREKVLRDLEMLHEYGDDDIDEYELRDKDEDDEVDGSNECVDAAVAYAVDRRVTVASQRVLVHAIRPTRTSQHSQECKDPRLATFTIDRVLSQNKWASRTRVGPFLCQVWWSYLKRFLINRADKQTDRQTDRHTDRQTSAKTLPRDCRRRV